MGTALKNCDKKNEKELITSNVTTGQPIHKAQPAYPAVARAARASGEVVVMLIIDETGKVIAAQVVSGHPLLRATCIKAAKESTFSSTLVEGKAVKVLGTITYKFVSQ